MEKVITNKTYPDVFEIYTDGEVVYKKIKNEKLMSELKNHKNFLKYKKIIENSHLDRFYGQFTLRGYDVERNGSYKSRWIKGLRLDKIPTTTSHEILEKIASRVKNLQNILDINSKDNMIRGDWALHNLIYSSEEDRVYNVDLEGFYHEKKIDWGGCTSDINRSLNHLISCLMKHNESKLNRTLNVVKYARYGSEKYKVFGSHKDIGYHSLTLDGNYYRGQRECRQRLGHIMKEVDFHDKKVLDIGCCVGGMLFPLSCIIKEGVGLDYNHFNINAGNVIKKYKENNNLSFYIFDLDKEKHSFINNFIEDVDVVFLFSMCMWVKEWKLLIDYIFQNSRILFIETNGTPEQQLEQIEYCRSKYTTVKCLYENSYDDQTQPNRKLYCCQ